MSSRALPVCFLVACLAMTARAQTPWERYLALPTPGNAQAVQTLAYRDSVDNVDRLLDDLDLLRDQVDAGDTAAVRLAFRLVPQADGVYGETLGTMLGRLVRTRPALFLRELARAERRTGDRAPHREVGCGLAQVTGPEYVDREEAGRYEARQRIAALRTVSTPSLRKVRDECLAALQTDLRRGA